MRSSVSIALFFLLSGLFLSLLLGAIERSRKLLVVAGACLVAVVCIIVFLTPVQLPDLGLWDDDDETMEAIDGTTTSTAGAITTSTTIPPAVPLAGTATTIERLTVTTSVITVTTGGPVDERY